MDIKAITKSFEEYPEADHREEIKTSLKNVFSSLTDYTSESLRCISAVNMELESFLEVLKTTNTEIKEYNPAVQAIDLWNKHLEECFHVIQPQVKELKQLQAQTAQLKQYLQEIDQYVSQLETTVKEL